MQKTFKERTENLKGRLQKLAETASKSYKECDRDGELAILLPQRPGSASWNKGWSKYGKT